MRPISRLAIISVISSAAAATIPVTPATAAVVSYKEGYANALVGGTYTGASESTLIDVGPNDNFGGIGPLWAGAYINATQVRRAIVHFDVSSLAGEYNSIDGATLILTTRHGPLSNMQFDVYQIADANAGWAPTTNSWNNRINPSTPWAGGAGLDPTGVGVASNTPIASFVFPNTYSGGDPLSITLPASLVQQWVEGVNAGLLIVGTDETISENSDPSWYSSYESSLTHRPEMVVEYSVVPEPGTMTLALAGGIALLGLRRRAL